MAAIPALPAVIVPTIVILHDCSWDGVTVDAVYGNSCFCVGDVLLTLIQKTVMGCWCYLLLPTDSEIWSGMMMMIWHV